MKAALTVVVLSLSLMQTAAFAADATMPMQETMQQMQTAMAAIKAEQDPAKRQALITQHMELMRKNMQMMQHGNDAATAPMSMEDRMANMQQQMNIMQMMMDQMMQHHGEESAQPAHQHE